MQFDDPKSILEAAAAKPSRGIDAPALVRQGTRLRRARLAAMATGVAVVVVAASVSFGALSDGRRDDAAPGPAAPSPDDRCGPPSSRASFYLRDDVRAVDAKRLLRRLEAELRELDGALRATYVSHRAAYREFAERYREKDPETSQSLPWTALPARLDFENIDDATIAALEKRLAGRIDGFEHRTNTTGRDGACVEVVEGGKPSEPVRGPNVDVSPAERDRVEVDLRRAECRTGTVKLDGGTADFVDGSKWCTLVVFVDNGAARPVRLEMKGQTLWMEAGDSMPPWEDAMVGDFANRLFTSVIGPGEQRLGEMTFLLTPWDVPAQLEIVPARDFAPVTIPLDYDCPADLRTEPRRRCSFGEGSEPQPLTQKTARVRVTLYHCGVLPLRFGDRRWVVADPPFDATNAPEDFVGQGRFERKSAVTALYNDDSGEVILCEEIEDWEQPICN